MKNTAIHIFIYLLLIYVAGQSFKFYLDEHQDKKRWENNFKVYQDSTKYYRTKAGKLAGNVTALEMTVKELRSTMPGIIADLKFLYIRPYNLKSYTQTSTETKKEIVTGLKDSIPPTGDTDRIRLELNPNSRSEIIKTIHYSDKWFNVDGTIKNDTAKLSIATTDTIKTVISYGRKVPALWIFSPKEYKATVTNVNPFIKFKIAKCVIIKK